MLEDTGNIFQLFICGYIFLKATLGYHEGALMETDIGKKLGNHCKFKTLKLALINLHIFWSEAFWGFCWSRFWKTRNVFVITKYILQNSECLPLVSYVHEKL